SKNMYSGVTTRCFLASAWGSFLRSVFGAATLVIGSPWGLVFCSGSKLVIGSPCGLVLTSASRDSLIVPPLYRQAIDERPWAIGSEGNRFAYSPLPNFTLRAASVPACVRMPRHRRQPLLTA